MDRCALFVDASYLLADGAMGVHGTRHREAVSWDFPGLLQLLGNLTRERSGLPLLRCYWYEATVEGRRTPEHEALADLPGLKLRLGRIRPGRREGVDSEIHRDLMTLARNGAVADAIVVSGDEDLGQVVADAQDLGLRVTVVHVAVDGNWTISRVLRQECDDLIEIGAGHLRPYVNLLAGSAGSSSAPLSNGQAAPMSNGHAAPLSNGHAASSGNMVAPVPTGAHAGAPPGSPIGAVHPPSPQDAEAEARASLAQNSSPLAAPPAPQQGTGSPGNEDTAHNASHNAPQNPPQPAPIGGSAPVLHATPMAAPVPAPAVAPPAGAPGAAVPAQQAHPAQQAQPGTAETGVPNAQPGQQAQQAQQAQPGQAQQAHGVTPQAQTQPPQPATATQPGGAASLAAAPTAVPNAPSVAANPQATAPAPAAAPASPQGPQAAPAPGGQAAAQPSFPPQQAAPFAAGQQASQVPAVQQQGTPAVSDAVKSAHKEGQDFGESVARDAPALWLEAVLARKPRMPSDLEARLLQGSSLPIDFLLHDEVRHALRRGFWDALERSRR